MGSVLFQFAVTVIAAWLVWRVMTLAMRPSHRGEPADSEPGDFAVTPANLRPRPRQGAGAIAVAEPEEDQALSFPPRTLRR